jgi:16S rRNA (adenine1518-N6/adenine1519-N6)-dimethyltransferase
LNLYDPGTLKEFLGRHGLSAKKGLGQHFLCSRSVVRSIVESVADCRGVLEIGPGPGVLTSPLSEASERMIALELDPRMIEALRESAPQAEVRQVNALETDLSAVLAELPTPRAVVSNLPYYITGPLLTRVAEAKGAWTKAVLMMQKEVGERVTAAERTPARGSLSVYLQSQFQIRRVAAVPAGAFVPPPKVDSVVLELTPRPEPRDPEADRWHQRVVRLGFTQPRKTLANNLSVGLARSRDAVLGAIASAELPPTARPQELSLEEWSRLAEELRKDEGIG